MSRGAIRNFIHVKPMNTSKPSRGVIDVDAIVGWKIHNDDNTITEIILSNGHGFLSNEPVEEFEKRLAAIVPTWYVD